MRANAPTAGSPDSSDDTDHATCAIVEATTPPSRNGRIRPKERPVAANTPETLRSGSSHPSSQQHASRSEWAPGRPSSRSAVGGAASMDRPTHRATTTDAPTRAATSDQDPNA